MDLLPISIYRSEKGAERSSQGLAGALVASLELKSCPSLAFMVSVVADVLHLIFHGYVLHLCTAMIRLGIKP
jgi:hypothetical protein